MMPDECNDLIYLLELPDLRLVEAHVCEHAGHRTLLEIEREVAAQWSHESTVSKFQVILTEGAGIPVPVRAPCLRQRL